METLPDLVGPEAVPQRRADLQYEFDPKFGFRIDNFYTITAVKFRRNFEQVRRLVIFYDARLFEA